MVQALANPRAQGVAATLAASQIQLFRYALSGANTQDLEACDCSTLQAPCQSRAQGVAAPLAAYQIQLLRCA